VADQEQPLDDELRVATEAACMAGAEIRRLAEAEGGVRYGHKHGWELVTEADLRAADILQREIAAAFPGDAWLSEEHPDDDARLGARRVWIVDPIDGTREYLLGIPEYAVSIALCIDGVPRVGVVHNPATGEIDAAVCPDPVEERRALVTPQPLVLVGRREFEYREIPPLPRGTRVGGIGSMAYRLAVLARGKADAVVTGYGRSEWDVAAGVVLCAAAGLRVTDVLGAPLRFNQPDPWVRGILAGTAPAHGALLAHLRQFA
jgi:myo-inositol-1(or 4)-monophosphatase